MANLTFIGDATSSALYLNYSDPDDSYLAQTGTANTWGLTGQDYNLVVQDYDDYSAQDTSFYTDKNYTNIYYRFVDLSPNNLALSLTSQRTVNATADCTELNLTYGGYAGYQSDNSDEMFTVSWIDENGAAQSYWIDNVASGSTTWLSNMSSDCGPRCTQVYALQSADNFTDDVPVPRFWSCFSNVSIVDGVEYYDNPDMYKIPDEQAQILAGAIGWSGVTTTETTSSNDSSVYNLQMVRYPPDSQWSPDGYQEAVDMAWLLELFTGGAIAALDDNGPRLNTTGYYPGPAQVINVKWKFALLILVGVPVVQAIVWMLVIMFANKVIIKDTSHLSTARLLRPIVDKLGDNGCLLTGDEIAEVLGNYKVIYGVRDPGFGQVPVAGAGDDGNVRHIDILNESEGLGYRRGRMPMGRYDGVFPSSGGDVEDENVALLSDQGRASTMEACEQDGMWWKRNGNRHRRLSV